MEKLVRFFVSRPLVVNVIMIALLLISLKTIFSMQKEGFPRVSMHSVTILTRYPGASARDVELNVTVPIEEALTEVSGVEEVISTSKESLSQVTVEIDENASDQDFIRIYDDIKNSIDAIDDLPKEIDGKPILKQVTSDDTPIIEIATTGPLPTLRQWVPRMERSIQDVNGVAGVTVVGLPDEEILIQVDPAQARRHRVGLRSIAHAIETRNIHGSGGTMESFLTAKKIVSYNKFESPQDVLKTILRMSPDGHGITLGKVADIAVTSKEDHLNVRNNGNPGVSILVTKKPHADIIETIDHIKTSMTDLNLPSTLTLDYLNDKSQFTRNRLKLLGSNALIGFTLVAILLMSVLGPRPAFWVSIGIPFALVLALAMTPFFDVTLNAISLGGFVLILGMLVDDAIVVADQINRFREQGYSPREAAVAGIRQVWRPVLASMITTVIAFLPIAYLGGLPGKFVWAIPLVVALTLIASLIECYFFLPSHLAHGQPRSVKDSQLIRKLETDYRWLLSHALKFRYITVSTFILILASAGFLATQTLNKNPFPQDAAEAFMIKITLPHNASLERTENAVARAEKVLLNLPENELVGFSTRIGTHSIRQDTDQGSHSNRAIIFVYLTPFSERLRTATDIGSTLRGQMASRLPGEADLAIDLVRLGPPVGREFAIRVTANNDSKRHAATQQIQNFLTSVNGVRNVDHDAIPGKDELNIRLDYDLLARTGLTVSDVITTLRIAFDGIVVTDLADLGDKKDFRLTLNKPAQPDMNYIGNLPILNRRGQLINLNNIVKLEQRPAAAEYHHVNNRRTTTVFGNINRQQITPEQVIQLVRARFADMETAEISFAGEPIENEKIFKDLSSAMVMALLGTYFVITLILNSLAKPAIVMTAVPFGMVGIVLALYFHSMPLSMFAMISLIGLTGIIVNGSIVMIYAIDSRNTASSRDALIEGAVSRLRPILLSVLTTVSGLFPTAYGVGGFDPFISPMCLTMGYGLLFGSLVLLFLVPALYAIGDDLHSLKKKRKTASHLETAKSLSKASAVLLAIGLLAPAKPIHAQPVSLLNLLKEVENHPLVKQTKTTVAGAKAKRSLLEAPYDPKLTIRPQIMYHKTESDSPFNYGDLTTQKQQRLDSQIQKLTKKGIVVGAEVQAAHTRMDNVAKIKPGQPMAVTLGERSLSNINVTGFVRIPLLKGRGNRTLKSRYAALSANLHAKEIKVEQTKSQIKLQISQLFWNAYLKKSNWQMAKRVLNRLREIHHTNKTKHRLGIINDAEFLESQLNLEKQKALITQRRGDFEDALLTLNKALSRPEDDPIAEISAPDKLDMKALTFTQIPTENLLKHHPVYRLTNTNIKAIGHELETIRLENQDALDFTLSVSNMGREENFTDGFNEATNGSRPTYMASMNYEINWHNTKKRHELEHALSNKRGLNAQRERIKSEITSERQRVRRKMASLNRQLQEIKNIITIRETLVNARQEEFEDGRSTTKELTEAEISLETAQFEIIAINVTKHLVILDFLANSGLIETYETYLARSSS